MTIPRMVKTVVLRHRAIMASSFRQQRPCTDQAVGFDQTVPGDPGTGFALKVTVHSPKNSFL